MGTAASERNRHHLCQRSPNAACRWSRDVGKSKHYCTGRFVRDKEHYDLRLVKARTKKTEILYIFFGIHTENVVQLADRIEHISRPTAVITKKYIESVSAGKLCPCRREKTNNPAR